jgi:cyclic beta-1,2-glucan synthetase
MGLCALASRLKADLHCRRLRLEPAVRSAELLLQERVPLDAPAFRPEEVVAAEAPVETDRAVNRRITRTDTPAPRTHLLSNGRYTVMVTNAGTGFSLCRGLAVSRWRVDSADDHYGTFLYIRDADTGRVWSAGHQPVCAEADEYEVVFSVDKAEFRRRDGWVGTGLEVTVAPDGDVEVRRLTLVNHDIRPRTLEVTSYVEVVLNDPRADLAHPAFGKLFLETEWLPRWHALACRRRPRSPDQQPVWAVHVVARTPLTRDPRSTRPIVPGSSAGGGRPPTRKH